MDYREQYELGIAEFNNGEYFECHDTFEDLWMHERGDQKRFLQGLIQGAVGIFHATRNNFNGSESQLTKAIDKLAGFPGRYSGVDVDALRNGLIALRLSIRKSTAKGSPSYNPDVIPKIDYVYDEATMSGLT